MAQFLVGQKIFLFSEASSRALGLIKIKQF